LVDIISGSRVASGAGAMKVSISRGAGLFA
jgi:hypothetical protein